MGRHTVLQLNEFLVLDRVRECGTTTRPDIATSLGLSAATVSRVVGRLLESGTVVEAGPASAGSGRRRTLIAFNERAGSVGAIDLGGTKCHGALADLAGTVLAEDVRPTSEQGEAYSTLVAMIDWLAREAAVRGQPVLALAIGVPAILEPGTGRAIGGPNVDWADFGLISRLAVDTEIPYVVENDVNLAALGHAWRGEGRGLRDFATLSLGTGIGAAVVANGQLVKGHHNAAGEIGYLVLDRGRLHRSTRSLGGLEEVAGGPAIAGRARELLEETTSPSRLRDSPVTTEAVVRAALEGDAIAATVMAEVLDAVAMAVIALAGSVDPELLILDGAVGRSLEPFLGEIEERVTSQLAVPPRLAVSTLGSRSTVIGAIAAALELAYRQGAPAESVAFRIGGPLAGV